MIGLDRRDAGSKPGKGNSDIEKFLSETAPLVEKRFSSYTGSVTLHIRDGKLASWEKKSGGRFRNE